QGIDDLKTRQYAVEGQNLYLQYCSNCHQKDGSGLKQLIPPLAGADYMLNDVKNTLYVIKNGIKGEIMVNGKAYNQPMPSNPRLTKLEIAQIATYIYNVWGNNKGLIDLETVDASLEDPSPISN
ncbi:MAG: cytochrome c, partial [Cyclobacteriaceae bacterium]